MNGFPRIVFKYLAQQVMQVLLAVSFIVLLIIMSGRFVSYLGQMASGALRADFLLAIIAYRIPEFLVMILPLGFFLGLIVTYGRLYVDNEMSVLYACGISRYQLLAMSMMLAVVVMALVAVLSLYLAPLGIQRVETILATQDTLTEFDTLMPGRFQTIDGGKRATYVESLSPDHKTMNDVFIAHRQADSGATGHMILLLADYAQLATLTANDRRYLLLHQGYRYDLTPGQPAVRVTQYTRYGIQMPEPPVIEASSKERALSSQHLWHTDQPEHRAEWQWRIALPLLVPVVALMALPLAYVHPRRGRFFKLLPSLLLYLLYVMLLINCRQAIADGRLTPGLGLWWVHGLYLLLALVLYSLEPVQRVLARRQAWRA